MAANRSRTVTREASSIGDWFLYSSCQDQVPEVIKKLHTLSDRSSSDKMKFHYEAKINLLKELLVQKYMRLEDAYDEFWGKIPTVFHHTYTSHFNALKAFVDSMLGSNSGLPVLIVKNMDGERFMTIQQDASSRTEAEQLSVLSSILSTGKRGEDTDKGLEQLAAYWPGIMNLCSSSKERALLIASLSTCYSSTRIRAALGIHEEVSYQARNAIHNYAHTYEQVEANELQAAERRWLETVEGLESSLQWEKDRLIDSKDRLHPIQRENKEHDILNMEQRLHRMKISKRQYVQAVAKREIHQWKKNIMSQKGKGQGRTIIDRGAESKLLAVLEEQMVAHARRKGVAELQRRLQRKEMRLIANKWLKANGKRLIKSYETPRSWAKPRNLRSIQAKQHRGRGFFFHRKATKSFTEEHINMHYNRAHIKNYTRQLFSSRNKAKYANYAIRHCIDDKAYIRSGTSEGFSRPARTPLAPVDPTIQPELPAYDYPDKIGYVAPGVHLFINDMEENVQDGYDRFAISNATISVTCKPKLLYSSTATRWSNDMYCDRLKFPEEHEVPDSGLDIPRNILTPMIFIKDSCTQFLLSSIPEDYERCIESELCLKREIKRVSVLRERIEAVLTNEKPLPPGVSADHVLSEAEQMETWLETKAFGAPVSECHDKYDTFVGAARKLKDELGKMVPEYRPLDIQTSDAGPGVGSSEMATRLRLVENFLIHDLDLQCRFHFAPRDSKSHPVERVMASLNEAVGDGRFIGINARTLTEVHTEDELFSMTPDEIKLAEEKLQEEAAIGCAIELASRYNGTSCMGTSIHAHTPDSMYSHFFYDEEDLLAWHHATKKQKESKPGHYYFSFLEHTFETNYIRYDNGVEGIRGPGQGKFRCEAEVHRVPPPVPDLTNMEEDGSWHYYTPQTVPERYKNVTNREIDDFCPRAYLNKKIEKCGKVHLSLKKEGKNVLVFDANETWKKINEQLETFIPNICGLDLSNAAIKYAETVFLRDVKRAIIKRKCVVKESELVAIKSGPLKVTIQKRK